MIKIGPNFLIHESEIKLKFIRAQGPGGQHVNKVATAVQLRFNIAHALSIPETIRQRLLALLANKITREGELIIKANRFRTQERNKQDAFDRFIKLLKCGAIFPKKRYQTKPTRVSIQRRLTNKKAQAVKKSQRRKSVEDE